MPIVVIALTSGCPGCTRAAVNPAPPSPRRGRSDHGVPRALQGRVLPVACVSVLPIPRRAHGQYQAQTSSLSWRLSKLKTSVSDRVRYPRVSTVSGVVAALGEVNTAGQNLLAAVNTSCLSASPSSLMGKLGPTCSELVSP